MALLLDTSVLVDVERSGKPYELALSEREREQEHLISVITVSELVHGVHRAVGERRRIRRQAFVEGLLARFEPIPISPEIARIHAEVWARLEAAGAIIGAHDLWIAATALAHDLCVATSNSREFERVPGLSVLAL
jgi:tRNA(fMet)-specific endonuclease VapC